MSSPSLRYQTCRGPTSPGPHVTLMLTSVGPYVIIVWQAEEEERQRSLHKREQAAARRAQKTGTGAGTGTRAGTGRPDDGRGAKVAPKTALPKATLAKSPISIAPSLTVRNCCEKNNGELPPWHPPWVTRPPLASRGRRPRAPSTDSNADAPHPTIIPSTAHLPCTKTRTSNVPRTVMLPAAVGRMTN